jgi:hypothetical protein
MVKSCLSSLTCAYFFNLVSHYVITRKNYSFLLVGSTTTKRRGDACPIKVYGYCSSISGHSSITYNMPSTGAMNNPLFPFPKCSLPSPSRIVDQHRVRSSYRYGDLSRFIAEGAVPIYRVITRPTKLIVPIESYSYTTIAYLRTPWRNKIAAITPLYKTT